MAGCASFLIGETDLGQNCNMGGVWDGRLCVLFMRKRVRDSIVTWGGVGWEAVHPFLQEETSPEQNCNMGGVWSGRLCVLSNGGNGFGTEL